nr:hypothetical protein KV8917_350072 [Klebsiella variicola]
MLSLIFIGMFHGKDFLREIT